MTEAKIETEYVDELNEVRARRGMIASAGCFVFGLALVGFVGVPAFASAVVFWFGR